jgi:phage baseplate assembly protein W
MNDIFLEWGGDLAVSSSGDLEVANSTATVNQRVSRRLLTNPGDYLWNLNYGGGLAQFVGEPANTASIEAVVTTQLALESAVPATPAPQVQVSVTDAANGYITANIVYAESISMQTVAINVMAS